MVYGKKTMVERSRTPMIDDKKRKSDGFDYVQPSDFQYLGC
jgi:hypothetical protein